MAAEIACGVQKRVGVWTHTTSCGVWIHTTFCGVWMYTTSCGVWIHTTFCGVWMPTTFAVFQFRLISKNITFTQVKMLTEFHMSWQYQTSNSFFHLHFACLGAMLTISILPGTVCAAPYKASNLPDNRNVYHIAVSQLFWQKYVWHPEYQERLQHFIQPHLQHIF